MTHTQKLILPFLWTIKQNNFTEILLKTFSFVLPLAQGTVEEFLNNALESVEIIAIDYGLYCTSDAQG